MTVEGLLVFEALPQTLNPQTLGNLDQNTLDDHLLVLLFNGPEETRCYLIGPHEHQTLNNLGFRLRVNTKP